MSRINLSVPDVGLLEETAVLRALRSGWVAPLGPEVDAFEREVADRVGVAHGVAVASGTAALHLALLAVGVRPGDVVPTSTFTFAATVNAVLHAGARPVLVDVDPLTGNLCPVLLSEAVDDLVRSGERVGAVLPVDIYGKAADHATLRSVADRVGAPLVIDSAEALGASSDGRPVGSLGAASAFSFNGNKVMTTSGGGMLVTDDAEIAETARRLSNQARQPVAHYEHHEVGFNYKLSNVAAALGRAQLTRLDTMNARRREVRDRYRQFFAGVDGIEVLDGGDDSSDNCWLTCITVDEARTGCSAAELGAALELTDIESRALWKPMHRQPAYASCRSFVTGVSDRLFETGLALPSGSTLTDADLDRVCGTLAARLENSLVSNW